MALAHSIPYEDFQRMQVQHHGTAARQIATPPWAYVGSVALRCLLVRYVEQRAGFRMPQPGTERERLYRALARLEALRRNMEAVIDRMQMRVRTGHGEDGKFISRRRAAIQLQSVDTQLVMIQKNLAGLIARMAYLYYCVGLDSIGVGNELGLRPEAVRQTLWRLHRTWEKMTAEVYDPQAWQRRNKSLQRAA